MIQSLRFIVSHPLTKGRFSATFGRVLAWQIGTLFIKSPVAVPFVDDTRLLVTRGMTGATGNLYCGLHEFADMAFVLHALDSEDLFVDIGANVGSYTILAAGAAGARCISIEPVPTTFMCLLDNIHINNLTSRVTALNVGMGSAIGTLEFTAGLDTVNHVVSAKDHGIPTVRVPIERLDTTLSGRRASIIKLDVEGFETQVIEGAEETMRSPSLLAVVMELNGSGSRYGFDEAVLHQRMLSFGFTPRTYDPWTRTLGEAHKSNTKGNTLYVRGSDKLSERLKRSPQHRVLGYVL